MIDLETIDISDYLPHRFPFLLVDKVVSLKPDQSIIAIKNISYNEPHFQGHFPERPVMPGVLMIEALAQAAGMLIYLSAEKKIDLNEELFFLAGVDSARFKRIVKPGDQLILEVSLIKKRSTIWKFAGIARVGDEDACRCEFMVAEGNYGYKTCQS